MIILRNKKDGLVKELSLTNEQYEKVKDCLSPNWECITCQLHNDSLADKEKTKVGRALWKNKFFHIGSHFVVTAILFSLPYILPRLHIDPSALIGAGGLWATGYGAYFSYKLDKEGLRLK